MEVDDPLLRALIFRIEAAQRAFVAGDSKLYEDLFDHTEDATLTGPFGGPTLKGWNNIQPLMRRAASFFQPPVEDSAVTLEAANMFDDMILLRLTERNRVQFKNRDDIADWDLRVTLVFRPAKGEWVVLHRHADPLVEIDTARRMR